MNAMNKNTTTRTAFLFATLAVLAAPAAATPQVTGVSFDPPFISAGDRVNISANLKTYDNIEKTWDEDMELKAVLKPENRLARRHVTIEDSRDDSIGFLYPDGVFNQRYQVKVDGDAPTGRYDFEIHIQYLDDGEPVEIAEGNGEYSLTVVEEFSMPVDREGVDLNAETVRTEPTVLRPGDDTAELRFSLANTGNKPVEEVELVPKTPENSSVAFSGGEEFFVADLSESQAATRNLVLDLDEGFEPGRHEVVMDARYEDESGNQYSQELRLPFRVEGRPDLEAVDSQASMPAGGSTNLEVDVENTGSQDAETVTARVIAERTQPFSLTDRSSYIGELESGEAGTAVLGISADRAAAQKTHQVKVQLRATGDSEEGDSSVYTSTETVSLEVDGKTTNPLLYVGLGVAALGIGAIVYRSRSGGGDEE